MRLVLAAVTLLSLAVAVVAPTYGYPTLAAAAWVWLFVALVSGSAVLVVQRVYPWAGLADAVIRVGVMALAIVIGAGLVLGAAGSITRGAYVALLAVVFAASRVGRENPGPKAPRLQAFPSLPAIPTFAVAFTAALLIFIIGYGLSHSPLTAYDSLSYHLYFPGRWLQDHSLSIIPTPFSDEAQAYAPANGELYFLWLMLPLHGDLLARIGQVPFYLLIGVTLYALARRIGARAGHAVYAALFCFVSRPMVEQAVGADVDLICWAMFLSTLYLGLVATDRNERRDWVVWGIAAGLYFGTKYVALVYAPVIVLLPLLRGFKPRMAWGLAGIAAFALPWYLRNWIVAGSPLYPSSVAFAGVTLARGAFSRAAMLQSVFHTTDVRLFPVMAAHAFGTALILWWAPFSIIGGWRLATRRFAWPGWPLVLAPFLMSLLYWFGVPDNVDSRFLLPAAMLAQLPLAFVFVSNRRWNAVIHGLYAAGLLWALVGLETEIPAHVPWFMGGWLNLRGLVSLNYLIALIGLALASAVLLGASRRRQLHASLIAAVLFGAAILGRGALTWCLPDRCEYLRTTSIFLRPSFVDAWQWTEAHLSGVSVAYVGNNVPYPLMGSRLENRVRYVNIDRHTNWRFHDYARAAGQRQTPPEGRTLATSSGVLRPVLSSGGGVDAVRPRFERMSGDPQAWTNNLLAGGVDFVFISALSAYEIDNNWHNEGGFPIEDEWARADPQTFNVVYENPQVRIYAIGVRRHRS